MLYFPPRARLPQFHAHLHVDAAGAHEQHVDVLRDNISAGCSAGHGCHRDAKVPPKGCRPRCGGGTADTRVVLNVILNASYSMYSIAQCVVIEENYPALTWHRWSASLPTLRSAGVPRGTPRL
eukprot:1195043-Prorocentrum_minimum.AAC.2